MGVRTAIAGAIVVGLGILSLNMTFRPTNGKVDVFTTKKIELLE